MFSVDDLIARLQQLREESPLKGKTMVVISEPEIEYREISQVRLDTDEDGALVLLKP